MKVLAQILQIAIIILRSLVQECSDRPASRIVSLDVGEIRFDRDELRFRLRVFSDSGNGPLIGIFVGCPFVGEQPDGASLAIYHKRLAVYTAITEYREQPQGIGAKLFVLGSDILQALFQERLLHGRNIFVGVDTAERLQRRGDRLHQLVEIRSSIGLRGVDATEAQDAVAETYAITRRTVEELHIARSGVEPRVARLIREEAREVDVLQIGRITGHIQTVRLEIRQVAELRCDVLRADRPVVHTREEPQVGTGFVAGCLSLFVGRIAECHELHRRLRVVGATLAPFGVGIAVEALGKAEVAGREAGIGAVAERVVRIDGIAARSVHCRVQEDAHTEVVLA